MKTRCLRFGRGLICAGMLLLAETGGPHSIAFAETVFWTGAASTAWANSGNWTNVMGGAALPGPGTNVVINGGANQPTLNLSGGAVTIASLTIGETTASTLTFSNGNVTDLKLVVTGNAIVGPNGTLTHEANTTAETHRLFLDVGVDLMIDDGGAINVDGKGYSAGNGYVAPNTWNGGSHGGLGGWHDSFPRAGVTYGAYQAPTSIGGGGAGSGGGGAIVLAVSSNTIINGIVSANGIDGNVAGNGAGGSIFITTESIAGNGTIRANGGSSTQDRGAGAGGRIAIVLTGQDETFADFTTAKVETYGGSGVGGNGARLYGAAGTVYRETHAQGSGNGVLMIDNNGLTAHRLNTTIIPSDQNWTVKQMRLSSGGVLEVPAGRTLNLADNVASTNNGAVAFLHLNGGNLGLIDGSISITNWGLIVDNAHSITGNVTVQSGGVITHSANESAQIYRILLDIDGDLAIQTNGAINVDGKGYAKGNGFVTPGTFNGGSHGGLGGWHTSYAFAGETYGSIVAPTNIGSGGFGSSGGGAIVLDVSGNTAIHGTISANGADYAAHDSGNGAGGSIFITTKSISGDGLLRSNGGSNTSDRGAGGGGRIAIVLTGEDETFAAFGAATITAIGGTATAPWWGRYGAAGTVYRQAHGIQYGDLTISNSHDALNQTRVSQHVTDVNVGNVEILNYGKLEIGSNQTLSIHGNWSNTAGYAVEGDGAVGFAGTAEATIWGDNTWANLSIVTPGKTVRFDSGKTQTITSGFAFKGAEGNLLVLVSTAEDSPWHIKQNVVHDVEYVQVRDSNASIGSPVSALYSSDIANNANWVFTALGDAAWTGAAENSIWTATNNWNVGRAPLPDDLSITIALADHQPVLDINREFNGSLTIEPGATLTLNGRNLTINGAVTNAGTITATGAEVLTCRAEVDFTSGTFNRAQSTLVLDSASAQTFRPFDNTFYDIEIPNTNLVSVTGNITARNVTFSGNNALAAFNGTVFATNVTCHIVGHTGLTFDDMVIAETFSVTGTTVANIYSGGLAVDTFRDLHTGGGLLTFGVGMPVDVRVLILCGAEGVPLVLRSSASGSAWNLSARGFTSIRFVDAQDSDASGGVKVYAVNSIGAEANNTNWDFGAGKAWVGTNPTWSDPDNWSPTGAPDSNSYVLIDGKTSPILNLASDTTTLVGLTLGPTVASTLTLQNGNVSDKKLIVTGNVGVGDHGTLTHSSNSIAETHRLCMIVGEDLTIETGGAINVDGKGYSKGNGFVTPGTWNGGSHGGLGGWHTSYTFAGETYGSIAAPTNIGSGGFGSSGGGAIVLDVSGNTTIYGTISANGTDYSAHASGNGAGGSIFITTKSISGDGLLRSNGGSNTSDRGAGGGGRIAIVLTGEDETFAAFGAATITAIGGTATAPWWGRYGSAGTVYRQAHGMQYGDLTISNSHDALNKTRVSQHVTDINVDHVEILNYGKLEVGSGQALAIYGDWSNTAGYAVLGAGAVAFAGSASAKVWNDNTWGNLTIATRGKTVRFEAGKTQTVNGTPVFDNGVTLLSTVDGTQWYLRKDGDGIQEVGRVSVRDSHAGTWGEHRMFQATGGVDMGNNVNWGEWPPLPTVIMLR